MKQQTKTPADFQNTLHLYFRLMIKSVYIEISFPTAKLLLLFLAEQSHSDQMSRSTAARIVLVMLHVQDYVSSLKSLTPSK